MVRRVLKIGRWIVDFLFVTRKYDKEGVLAFLYELRAPRGVILRAEKIIDSGEENRAFTYTDQYLRRGVVVIGPTSSGAEFLDSFSHEIDHLADAIAESLGIKENKEGTSYITGDTTRALAEVICEMGCNKYRQSHD